MKRTFHLPVFIVLISVFFTSCKKVPDELLVGTWDGTNNDLTITFGADWSYSYSLPYPGADPNSGSGSFEFSGDTLIIETCVSHCYITKFFWTVDESQLELRLADGEDVLLFSRRE